jgi:hypothetical protein
MYTAVVTYIIAFRRTLSTSSYTAFAALENFGISKNSRLIGTVSYNNMTTTSMVVGFTRPNITRIISMSFSLLIVQPNAVGFELFVLTNTMIVSKSQTWILNSTKFIFTNPINVYIHPLISMMLDQLSYTYTRYRIQMTTSTTVSTNKLNVTTYADGPSGYDIQKVQNAVLLIAKQINNIPIIHYSSIAQVGSQASVIWPSNNFGAPVSRFNYPQISTHCLLGIQNLQVTYDYAGGTEDIKFGWVEYYPDLVGLYYKSSNMNQVVQ